jgi:carbonic anhydrase
MRDRIVEVNHEDDIFPAYRETPIGRLLEYHNLGREFDQYTQAHILIGMCMDNRKFLRIPDNFAYVIRTGGGSLRTSEFRVSYAVAVGGVRCIAIFSHDNCGMSHLAERRVKFVDGLVDAGWERGAAEDHFMHFAPLFEIGDPIGFVLSEAKRLRQRYPGVIIAPLHYDIEKCRLALLSEKD